MSPHGRYLLSALLTGACTAIAVAGFTAALDPLGPAVDERMRTIDTGFPNGLRDLRRLERVSDLLDTDTTSVKRDLRIAGKVARILDRRLPHMVELGDLMDDALLALEGAGVTERDGLAAWRGHLLGDRREARLARALDGFDLAVERARRATTRVRRARRLRIACRRIARAATALEIDPDDVAPVGLPALPLPDVNPSSTTFGFEVSPRDFDGLISAWYFGHST